MSNNSRLQQHNKTEWFRRTAIFYVPDSFPGWIILVAGIAFAVYRFIQIDRVSHSASDTLRNFFFSAVIIAIIYSIIAFLTSRDSEK